MPLFQERTALAPAIERRVTIISSDSGDVDPKGLHPGLSQ